MATTSLPQNLITSSSLRESFEDKDDWTPNADCTVVDDAVHYKVGAQSIEVTSPVGSLGMVTKAVGPWDLSGSEECRLWFYVDDLAKVQGFFVRLTDVTQAKYCTSYPIAKCKDYAGWNLISIKNDEWSMSGGMTLDTPVAYIRMGITGAVGEQAVGSFDGFYTDVVATPALMLTFDDASSTVYTNAHNYMQPRNIPGTFYIKTSAVNAGAGFVTSAQLLTMQASGWTIANHTQTHPYLTTLTEAQIEAEWLAAVADLTGWGITGNAAYHMGCPFGDWDDVVLKATGDVGALTHRIGQPVGSPIMPFDEAYKIPLAIILKAATSLATVKAWLDTVIADNRLGICVGHTITDGVPGEYEWAESDFQAFINYVIEQQIPCITMDEAYLLQSGALNVAAPTTPSYITMDQQNGASIRKLGYKLEGHYSLATLLVDSAFTNPAKIRIATDEQLQAVGVTDSQLAWLREVY